MPTDLEDLVGFLHHGNTQIRQIAVETLVGYSSSNHAMFKINELEPIRDLKLLVKDYNQIAKTVMIILMNLSEEKVILTSLATDDSFIESLLARITNEKEPNANEIAMLLANMSKADELQRIWELQRSVPEPLSTSRFVLDQLMDCFVKGAAGSYNKNADFDYLSYFFADLCKHDDCRKYFATAQERDNNIIPLTKLTVFTEHKSDIRRRGVASTIKNVAFEVKDHPSFLDPDKINIMPYILLPLMGPEEYSDEDTEGMLEDLQLLPPDKEREKDKEIMKTHLETLLLLTTTREGRDYMRQIKVYPIVRECHLHVDDDEVREACDRVVQIIARDEEGEGEGEDIPKLEEQLKAEAKVEEKEEEEEDEEDQIVEIL